MFTVYYQDKTVVFCRPPAPQGFTAIAAAREERIDAAKLLQILDNCNNVALVSHDPEALFTSLFEPFERVEAAGGVACDERGRVAMIRRNGRWELPKGHTEPHESETACALRETQEETGAKGLRAGRLIGRTLHFYFTYGRAELKRTAWYRLHAPAAVPLSPQREEGITAAEWCTPSQVRRRLAGSYPSVRRVFELMQTTDK